MFNKEWKTIPNESQTNVLQFLESYMDIGVSVYIYISLHSSWTFKGILR